MNAKNILVTGGAGFIGSHLTDALIDRGHKVTILDKFVQQVHGGSTPAFLNPKARLLRGDVCDPETVAAALEQVSVVFHQAAEVGVGQSMYEPVRYMHANTLGTTVLLDQIRQRKKQIRKLIVASSMSIYGEGEYSCTKCGRVRAGARCLERLRQGLWEVPCPQCGMDLVPVPTNEDKQLSPNSVYAVSKQDQEQLCLIMGRAYEVPTVGLRYFNGYGTRQALSNPYTGVCAIFCARLLNDSPPMVYEDGKQTRDFVHVSDIVQANLLAMETSRADYQALNIGSGKPISIRDVALLLASKMGKHLQPNLLGEYREGDIRHCVADIGKAQKLLGYAPQVELNDGIKELIVWVKCQVAKDLTDIAGQELAKQDLLLSATRPASAKH